MTTENNIDYRARFMNTLLFKTTHEVPFHEIALWQQTVDRFKAEGAPAGAYANNGWFMHGDDFYGFEPREFLNLHANTPIPGFTPQVLEEDERIVVYIDGTGVTRRSMKDGSSMDQFCSFPVHDRESFRALKKRFTTDFELRYPEDWTATKRRFAQRNCPLSLTENGDFGFYSIMRTFMGTEGVSYVFYDDPDLAHEMLEFFCDYIIELTGRALKETDCDYFNIWEDMSFNNGPLVSPDTFKEFFLPRYKRLINHLRAHGIQLITIDTDGDPRKLIPYYLEAGINCLWPVEVAAGVDAITLRKEYGSDLALMGGIDKRPLAQGKQAIDYELKRVLDYMLPRGGYIPTVDHAVPPDVSYENFLYYVELKRELLAGK